MPQQKRLSLPRLPREKVRTTTTDGLTLTTDKETRSTRRCQSGTRTEPLHEVIECAVGRLDKWQTLGPQKMLGGVELRRLLIADFQVEERSCLGARHFRYWAQSLSAPSKSKRLHRTAAVLPLHSCEALRRSNKDPEVLPHIPSNGSKYASCATSAYQDYRYHTSSALLRTTSTAPNYPHDPSASEVSEMLV